MNEAALTVLVVAAGAVGGALNALIVDKSFRGPYLDLPSAGERGTRGWIWYPGSLANVVIGAVSAGANWALNTGFEAPEHSGRIVAIVFAAIMVGVAGGTGGKLLADKTGGDLLDAGIGNARAVGVDPAEFDEDGE